jgi:hypothetical protein
MEAAAQAVFLERLRLLPIAIEHRPATWLAQQVLPLARTYRLSAYDAAYLELAIREGLPLATLDMICGARPARPEWSWLARREFGRAAIGGHAAKLLLCRRPTRAVRNANRRPRRPASLTG